MEKIIDILGCVLTIIIACIVIVIALAMLPIWIAVTVLVGLAIPVEFLIRLIAAIPMRLFSDIGVFDSKNRFFTLRLFDFLTDVDMSGVYDMCEEDPWF